VLGNFAGVPNRHAPAGPPWSMSLKKLIGCFNKDMFKDMFNKDMLQLFDFERVLFDYLIPVDQQPLEPQLATSGAKAARIVFLTSSTIS
jgi:hypothetical protein